jgi:hypothetical protein
LARKNTHISRMHPEIRNRALRWGFRSFHLAEIEKLSENTAQPYAETRGDDWETLERKVQPATYRARILHQVDSMTILAENGHIPLGEQVAEINESFYMAGENQRNRLT